VYGAGRNGDYCTEKMQEPAAVLQYPWCDIICICEADGLHRVQGQRDIAWHRPDHTLRRRAIHSSRIITPQSCRRDTQYAVECCCYCRPSCNARRSGQSHRGTAAVCEARWRMPPLYMIRHEELHYVWGSLIRGIKFFFGTQQLCLYMTQMLDIVKGTGNVYLWAVSRSCVGSSG
jgi:hypothetical protein